MSTSTPAFRTQMGGFHKKDVTDYIAKLSREYDETLSEKDNEIKELKKRLDDSEAALLRAGESNDEAVKEELAKANGLIEAQTEQLEVAEALNAELEEKIAELTSKLDKYADMDTKCSRYESMASRMGEIFMEASADADRIRNDAKDAAEALISKTDAECRTRRSMVESMLSGLAASRKAEILRLFGEAQGEIVSILDAFETNSAELSKVTLPDADENSENAE